MKLKFVLSTRFLILLAILVMGGLFIHAPKAAALGLCSEVGTPSVRIQIDGYGTFDSRGLNSFDTITVTSGTRFNFTVYTFAEPSSSNNISYPFRSQSYSAPNRTGRLYTDMATITSNASISVQIAQNCQADPNPGEVVNYSLRINLSSAMVNVNVVGVPTTCWSFPQGGLAPNCGSSYSYTTSSGTYTISADNPVSGKTLSIPEGFTQTLPPGGSITFTLTYSGSPPGSFNLFGNCANWATSPTVQLYITPSSGAAGYNLYKATNGGGLSQIASGLSYNAMNTYVDSSIARGSSYNYQVEAYNGIAPNALTGIYGVTIDAASCGGGGGATQSTLSVSKNGTGAGTVTSNVGGINCGSTCSAIYNNGTAVTLTANAASGSSFAGWAGGGCSGVGNCNLVLNSNTTVNATFNLDATCNGGLNAFFVDQTIAGISYRSPTTIKLRGSTTYPVTVTMQDAPCAAAWPNNATPGYFLGSQNPVNNNVWGLSRVPSNGPFGAVRAGETTVFSFPNITTPPSGINNFQWQMVYETVAWFGDYTPNITIISDSPPDVVIDNPPSSATNVSGTVLISGWALDNAVAAEGSITALDIQIDGVTVNSNSYGNYTRGDVCSYYPGRIGCPNVGYVFNWNSATVANGSHRITVRATDDGGYSTSVSRDITVTNSGTITVTVTPNINTSWTLNGPQPDTCNPCATKTYNPRTTGNYSLSNVGNLAAAGYGPAVVNPAQGNSQTLTNGGNISWTINYPPAAPTISNVVNSTCNQLTVNWNNISTATNYRVWRSTTNTPFNFGVGDGWTNIATKAAGATTHTDNTVTGGSSYYYIVEAVGIGGSTASNSYGQIVVTCAGTITVTVTPNINTSWSLNGPQPNTCNPCATTVYSSRIVGAYSLSGVANLAGYAPAVVNPAQGNSQTLTNGGNISWTINYPPAAPTISNVVNSTCNQLTVNWNNISTATNYRVWRSTTNTPFNFGVGDGWTNIATKAAGATTHTDNTVTGGSSYYYIVEAVGIGGSTASNSYGSTIAIICAANLSGSSKTISQVQGAAYSNNTVIKEGDLVTFQIGITNTGSSSATINYICDTPSANFITLRNLNASGSGVNVRGRGNLPRNTGRCSGANTYDLDISGVKTTGGSWTVTFDSNFQSSGAGRLEVCSNTAVIYFSDAEGNKTQTVRFPSRLCSKSNIGNPNFQEVAP